MNERAIGRATVEYASQEDGPTPVSTRRWFIGAGVAVAAAALAVGGVLVNSADEPNSDLVLVGQNSDVRGLKVVGLTADQRLVGFDVARPGSARDIGKVRGLAGDAKLVGIDFRVQDGLLYGVGNQGGVYTLSVKEARATKVSQLTVALDGTSYGVDFNPAADRLRIVSDTGQNLRHNVNAGGTTLADGTLALPPATTPATGVTAVAYTNNDLNADTATTLFDLDTTLDQVAVQAPANAGQLSPVGKLGVDAGSVGGFDIYATVKRGKAVDAVGLATLSVGGKDSLYRISLVTGQADQLGGFPRGVRVTDIAVPLAQ